MNNFISFILYFNMMVPIIGAAITLFALSFSKINTKNLSIQITYILFMFIWIMLYLADYSTTFQPNVQSSISRILSLGVLISLSFYAFNVTQCIKKLKTDIENYAKSKKVKNHLPCLENITPTSEKQNDCKKQSN